MIERKYIRPGTKLPVRLSTRERDLVAERAFLDSELETTLRKAATINSKLVVNLTLDDIDDLHGCVAAEANHCDDRKVRQVLDAVCQRLGQLLDQFTDEVPIVPAKVESPRQLFTAKQEQYLAFIHYYTKLHGVPPAEADLQRYFKVSPPVVHAMILTLERRGFINRTPGKARSVQLRISKAQLPDF